MFKMDCRAAQQNIDLYIEGLLEADDTRQLEQHLDTCAVCKKTLDEAIRLKHALGTLAEVEPPPGLAVSALRKARQRPVYAYVTAATAVAAAAVVLVAVFATGGMGTDRSEAMPKESLMFSADSAAEESLTMEMAPREEPRDFEAEGGMAEALRDEAKAPADAKTEDESTRSPRSYDSEPIFAAFFGADYFKPAVLPDGASFEAIADTSSSVLFSYRLAGGEWYYFEWLYSVQGGGAQGEIMRVYGGLEMFSENNGYYVFTDNTTKTVYWEQEAQVFRLVTPAPLDDITKYASAVRQQ